jgi:hypothetical protein
VSLPIEIDDSVSIPPSGVNGGLAKAAKSAQRKVKPKVHVAYRRWQAGEVVLFRNNPCTNKSQFAEVICGMYSEVDSSTVLRWIRAWEKEISD